MKRICTMLLAAVLVLGTLVCLPLSVSADNEKDFEYEIIDGEATITGYVGIGGSHGYVEIPCTLGGAPVTAIGDRAFESCSYVRDVNLPDGIQKVGKAAFRDCLALYSINFPDSMVSIGNEAFKDCFRLMKLYIPHNLTQIGKNAFDHCGCVESILVAGGNSTYHSSGNCLIETKSNTLVRGCSNSVIPDGVKKIGYNAFSGCMELKSICIPGSVTTIETDAFISTGLTEIHIPKNVVEIQGNVFMICGSLQSISVAEGNPVYYAEGNCLIEVKTGVLLKGCSDSVIPDGVKVIGSNAFEYNLNLETIVIPNGVTEIGSYAFAECYQLTNVVIPGSVVKIGSHAFKSCFTPPSNIMIPKSVTEMGEYVFMYCEGLQNVYCEAESKPAGWADIWMDDHVNAAIHWGTEGLALTLGDLNGTGKIDSTDYMLLKRAVLGTGKLTDEQKAVADINKDGSINSTDYILLKRAVLGTYIIK